MCRRPQHESIEELSVDLNTWFIQEMLDEYLDQLDQMIDEEESDTEFDNQMMANIEDWDAELANEDPLFFALRLDTIGVYDSIY